MATDYSKLRSTSGSLFSLAMPPLLHFKGATVMPSSSFLPAESRSLFLTASSLAPALLSAAGSRGLEGALMMRELDLRAEYQRLRAEEELQSRSQLMIQRQREEEEERQRTMSLAREMEEERARRIEAQQERLLKKERELEEWKLERAREADVARRRLSEEEDRRREIQHQRDLNRIKEEAELRSSAVKKSEDVKKIVEDFTHVTQETMRSQLRQEISTFDEAYRLAAQRREEEWTHRIEALEVQRGTELASLTQQLQMDQARASRSDEQLSEARKQLTQLLHEVDSLKLQASSGQRSEREKEAIQQVAASHRTAIERLQKTYEDDKKDMLRRAVEERDRIKYEQDRRVEELKDANAAALRNKDTEIEQLERRVAQLERELQEEGTKASVARASSSQTDNLNMENSRLKEEVRQLTTTKYELEEAKKRLERTCRDADLRLEGQTRQLQTLQTETQNTQRQVTIERDALKKDNEDLKATLRINKDNYEEELDRLQRQLQRAEEEASKVQVHEIEQTARRSVEKAEEERRAAEANTAQANRKLKIAEDSLQSLQRSHDAMQREVTQLKAELASMQALLDQRNSQVHQLEHEVGDKSALEFASKEASTRFQRLQEEYAAEREDRRRQQEAAMAAKEKEMQQLRDELLDMKKQTHVLRESLSSSKFDTDESQQRLLRQMTEKDEEIATMRKQLDASQQSMNQWKATYEELQQRNGNHSDTYQKALRDRDSELEETRRLLRNSQDERSKLDQQLHKEAMDRVNYNIAAREMKSVIKMHEEAVASLQREVQELRHEAHRSRESPGNQGVAQWTASSPVPQSTQIAAVHGLVTNPTSTPNLASPPMAAPKPTLSVPSLSMPAKGSAAPGMLSPPPPQQQQQPPLPASHSAYSTPAIPAPPPPPPALAIPPSSVPKREESSLHSWDRPEPPTFAAPTPSVPHITAPVPVSSSPQLNYHVPTPAPAPSTHQRIPVAPAPVVSTLASSGVSSPLNIPVPQATINPTFQVGKITGEKPSMQFNVPVPAGSVTHSTTSSHYAPQAVPVATTPRTSSGTFAVPSVSISPPRATPSTPPVAAPAVPSPVSWAVPTPQRPAVAVSSTLAPPPVPGPTHVPGAGPAVPSVPIPSFNPPAVLVPAHSTSHSSSREKGEHHSRRDRHSSSHRH